MIQGTLHDFSELKGKDFKHYLLVTDGYEGCNPNNPEHSLYNRVLVEVILPDCKKVKAWMYVFNPKSGFGRGKPMYRIPKGLWENANQIKIRKSH